jgi:alkylation response protein AidB-like acyl-CoA dehydrogenase
MDLALNHEHERLRRSVRDFLREASPEQEIRRLIDSTSGYKPAVWARMSDRLGLQGLIIPKAYGGSGTGAVEAGVVLEEMGYALLCAPYLATCVLATRAILAAGDRGAARELLPGIACGVTIATLAFTEPDRGWNLPAQEATVRRSGGRWALRGTKDLVLDGGTADLILVTAIGEWGVGLYALSGDATGLVRTTLPTADTTRRLARLEFFDAPAHPIGRLDHGQQVLATAIDHAAVALAAESAGGAQRVLELAVGSSPRGYAEMRSDVGSARSAAYLALSKAATDPAELSAAAYLAKTHCANVYARTAAAATRLHGAEHDLAHLHLMRARSSQLLFSDSQHRGESLDQHIDADR